MRGRLKDECVGQDVLGETHGRTRDRYMDWPTHPTAGMTAAAYSAN